MDSRTASPVARDCSELATGTRWYAYTDNGDWMELTPQVDEDPLTGSGVSILAVQARNDEELYAAADSGEGLLLGRVTIVDGAPVLHRSVDTATS